jgi:hypothetical protein
LEIYVDAETSDGNKGREFGGGAAEVEGTSKDKSSSHLIRKRTDFVCGASLLRVY